MEDWLLVQFALSIGAMSTLCQLKVGPAGGFAYERQLAEPDYWLGPEVPSGHCEQDFSAEMETAIALDMNWLINLVRIGGRWE